jgi:hypothetical protein
MIIPETKMGCSISSIPASTAVCGKIFKFISSNGNCSGFKMQLIPVLKPLPCSLRKCRKI